MPTDPDWLQALTVSTLLGVAAALVSGAAGLDAGGEAGPVRSAGLLLVRDVSWPVADLRVDWTAGATRGWAARSRTTTARATCTPPCAAWAATPSPLNLFMNIPVHPDGTLFFDPPASAPGSHVALRAEIDLVIAFSACPQDILPINGVGHAPAEAHFSVG